MYTPEQREHIIAELSHGKDIKFWPPACDKIPGLNLAGKVSLSIFPDEAINFAYQETLKAPSITKPFAYLRRVCTDYCTKKNLPVAERWHFQLFDALKMDRWSDGAFVLQKPADQPAPASNTIHKGAAYKPFHKPTPPKPTDAQIVAFADIYHDEEIAQLMSRVFSPEEIKAIQDESTKIMMDGFARTQAIPDLIEARRRIAIYTDPIRFKNADADVKKRGGGEILGKGFLHLNIVHYLIGMITQT
jgi:hypothetical protein